MSEQQWHYSKSGKKHGPISSQKLKELAAAGAIHPTDLIWRDGMGDWQPASKVKGLFPSRAEQKASAPPPLPSPSTIPQPPLSSPPVVLKANFVQRLRTGVAKWPLWLRISLALLLTVIFWPVGVLLVWWSPEIALRWKWTWAGISLATLIYVGISLKQNLDEVDQHIKEMKALNEAQMKQDRDNFDKKMKELRGDPPADPVDKPIPKGDPKTTSLPAAEGRPLKVTVNTAGMERMARWIKQHNESLGSVKCLATESDLTIDFDITVAKWTPVRQKFPLLVRLFDKNGQHLTHFTTAEGFTVFSELYATEMNAYNTCVRLKYAAGAAKHKCILLKPEGNRVNYGVNVRDLRDASIVEIGFTEK